ncbi:N-glycosylase/DNA lyase [Alosa sapidissima]|uniref:N-glycosylase/DNA lyase n=1 Tax=Alosa sapidissima TaxID=34773 RepID=UPI001C0924BA|nr:N-glycosylase/DNA lyase [Alosa sapidissima]XP_041941893.1 N-glycosylase/DNA lyase [Alosa sapidissima]XP_041941894.1 N-glycosylase/DNA lyase [Alosa sapidissima]
MLQHALMSVGCKAWRALSCPISELRLDLTLGCGQTFRWRETGDGHWTGVMGGRVWTLTQTDDTLWYYVYTNQNNHGTGSVSEMGSSAESVPDKRLKGVGSMKQEDEEGLKLTSVHDSTEQELLKDYFQLNIQLENLYKDWGACDDHFRHIASIFTGVRMLKQDPVECLFSFICSSNNHISRIQGMVERLCHTLGPHLLTIEDTHYHDFPTLQALADNGVEACLRDLGFGYRARFLQQSARLILDKHSPDWLHQLRGAPYEEAREALRTLPGVGVKVADCVCLMSLDKLDAVPVDTHVWQIAKRDYGCSSGNGQKTLTDKVHREIGDFFRQLWGPYAGWAHSVLFCADLKKFQKLKERAAGVKAEWVKSEGDQKGKSNSKKQKDRLSERNDAKGKTAKKMKLEKPLSRNRTVKEEGE